MSRGPCLWVQFGLNRDCLFPSPTHRSSDVWCESSPPWPSIVTQGSMAPHRERSRKDRTAPDVVFRDRGYTRSFLGEEMFTVFPGKQKEIWKPCGASSWEHPYGLWKGVMGKMPRLFSQQPRSDAEQTGTEVFMTYKTLAMCALQKLSSLTSFVIDQGGWSSLPNSEYRITHQPPSPPPVALPLCPLSTAWKDSC